MYGLRHTHASVLIYKGVNILAVSKRLGHIDLSVTMETYSHVLSELKEQEDIRMKEILASALKS